MKVGYKTTEFWFLAIAAIAGLLLTSGLLPDKSLAAQIIGGIGTTLSTLGYVASRTIVKKNE